MHVLEGANTFLPTSFLSFHPCVQVDTLPPPPLVIAQSCLCWKAGKIFSGSSSLACNLGRFTLMVPRAAHAPYQTGYGRPDTWFGEVKTSCQSSTGVDSHMSSPIARVEWILCSRHKNHSNVAGLTPKVSILGSQGTCPQGSNRAGLHLPAPLAYKCWAGRTFPKEGGTFSLAPHWAHISLAMVLRYERAC